MADFRRLYIPLQGFFIKEVDVSGGTDKTH